MQTLRVVRHFVPVLALSLLLPLRNAAATPLLPSTETFPALSGIPIQPRAASGASQQQFLIELTDPPAAVKWAEALADRTVSKAEARTNAVSAARTQRVRIEAAQATLAGRLAASPINGREIFRISRALNAISIYADSSQLAALRRLPGVKAVHLVVPEVPLNATSVPFINAPQLWGNTLGLPENVTGAGVKIGIIDTGIDYQHPMFGGTGLLADYQANDRVTITPSLFPTAKVVGGTDFAGDNYTGVNAPVPDPNPTDCNGHGSHVAGTAAGFGVQADGTTYPGPYGPATPFGSLRIGPGVAPQALLYSLRIFGCSGSTGLTVQAIDWAIDPNGDDDFSDHLDVINMSLGSLYGGISDTSALASENASLAGVVVVAAAGNSGDTYFIHGSPASSARTISVAAVADSGISGTTVVVNSPAGIAGSYNALSNAFGSGAPSPSGQTANLAQVSSSTGVPNQGCGALSNAAAIAGNIALVERGTCTFETKVLGAQAAGAIGVVVSNNIPGDPTLVIMGADTSPPPPTSVTIPAVFISLSDANTMIAQLPGVNVTLAAVTSGDQIASFSSRGPRNATPPILAKPDISAPGVNIPSTQSGMTCMPGGGCITPTTTGFDAGGLSLVLSGTSMATPHVAGSAALMRQLHPDWSVEEIKALLMNGAIHSVFFGADDTGGRLGLGRAGVGRIDDAASAASPVTAFDDLGIGTVSLTFAQEVVGTLTQVKTVRLVNHGSTPQTYALGVDMLDAAPGVVFSFPGGSTVTVPPASSFTFDVEMDATGNLMQHVLEPTVAPSMAAPAPLTSLGNLPRQYLNESGGNITFSQGGNVVLRLPVYAAIHPATTMHGPSQIATGGAPAGSTTIPLSGTDLCTGTLSAGPTCTGVFPNDKSLVTPVELQVVHPRNTAIPPQFNIRYAGVASAAGNVVFGISTWGPWATPADVAFNVRITTGGNTRVMFNTDPGNLAANVFGASNVFGQDSFDIAVFNTATSGLSVPGTFPNFFSGSQADTRIYDNNVISLLATPVSLGITPTTAFTYSIWACPGFDPLCLRTSPIDVASAPQPVTLNALGLTFGSSPIVPDLNGGTVTVNWNTANLTADGSPGALLLHHHNAAGTTAQVVLLQGVSFTDLSIAQSVDVPNPTLGQNVTFTLTVTNLGPTAIPAGSQVVDELPNGLAYVSDDGVGAYDSTTGVWTLAGALAVNASSTLHVVATVETTDPVTNTALITNSVLIDPNPANDQASVTVSAPRSADVAITMTASPLTAHPGDSATFTVTLVNDGGDVAYSLNLQEAFPSFPALTATTSTASAGSFNSATGVWNVGSLAKGATETLAMTFVVPNTNGALTNNATAAASTVDPNTANNSATASVTVLTPASVSGIKTVSGTFREGGTVTYTVTLTNGSAFAQFDNPGDEFDDTLPASLSLQSAIATSGIAALNTGTNTVSWNGAIAAGGSVTITITATVKSGTAGTTISNQGTIHFDADGNGTNESSAATANGSGPGVTSFLVQSPSAVSGVKTVSGPFQEGGTVTYSIVLTNNGAFAQLDNPGDEFDDVLPATLVLHSASATSGTAVANTSTNTVTWNGSIPAAGSVTITVTAIITGGTSGQTISNQGTIHFDADGNGTNESTAQTTNGDGGGATTFEVGSVAEVPTLGLLGLAFLTLALACGALLALRRRPARSGR